MEITLLEDFNLLEQYSVHRGTTGTPTYYLRGVFSRCDQANKNKRIYPRSVMEESIAVVQPLIERRGLVGELDHPPTPKVNVRGISHVITKLTIAPDGAVLGEAEAIDEHLCKLMEAKVRLGVSTRGLGKVESYNGPLGEGLVMVQPGYEIKAIDIVFDPSQSSFPNYVKEETEERKIVVGSTAKFRKVWGDVFGRDL
jgi:Prohead core protein serine protease